MNRHQHDPSGKSVNDSIAEANSSPSHSGEYSPLVPDSSTLARVQPLLRLGGVGGIDRAAESTLLPQMNDSVTFWGQQGFNGLQTPPSSSRQLHRQPEEKQQDEMKKPRSSGRGVKRPLQSAVEPTPLGSRRSMRVVRPEELGVSSLHDSDTLLECLRPLLPTSPTRSRQATAAFASAPSRIKRHRRTLSGTSTTSFVAHNNKVSSMEMDNKSSSSSDDNEHDDDVDYSIDYASPADESESYASEAKSSMPLEQTDSNDEMSRRKQPLSPKSSSTIDATARNPVPAGEVRFRASHKKQWWERFQDMVNFKETNGHCVVPLYNPSNPSLSHWVKRQRCQYKLKIEGKHSTLTDERQKLLEDLGFTWDSHNAAWEERFHELLRFKEEHGHCDVPSTYKENPPLASWIKCQRRYMRMYFRREADKKEAASRGESIGVSVGDTSNSGFQLEGELTRIGKKPRTISHSLASDRVQRMLEAGIQWEKKTGKKTPK